jgi:hypothetical protein
MLKKVNPRLFPFDIYLNKPLANQNRNRPSRVLIIGTPFEKKMITWEMKLLIILKMY